MSGLTRGAKAALLGVIAAGAWLAAATPAFDRPADARSLTVRANSVLTTPDAADLTLSQLAGQRIIYSYSGLTPPAALLARIRAGEAAGVIFFAPNIASEAQLAGVARELQAANRSSPVRVPLLLMTDQEGGLVRRLPGAPALSEKQIGESANGPALAAAAAKGAASNLESSGLNVDLAPVADVARQPGNFIDQYQRSYGPNPARDAILVSRFITAQQADGVASTVKHFPGLGAATTSQDADAEPVTLNVPLTSIRAVDETPFRAAIAAGVRLVMVSWAVYPALDAKLPAGLSAKVIGGELRTRLGFSGVTITDSLDAGALHAFGSLSSRALLAAHAGADLLLCIGTTALSGSSVVGPLVSALAHGRLSRAAAEQSVDRIISLRRWLEGARLSGA